MNRITSWTSKNLRTYNKLLSALRAKKKLRAFSSLSAAIVKLLVQARHESHLNYQTKDVEFLSFLFCELLHTVSRSRSDNKFIITNFPRAAVAAVKPPSFSLTHNTCMLEGIVRWVKMKTSAVYGTRTLLFIPASKNDNSKLCQN